MNLFKKDLFPVYLLLIISILPLFNLFTSGLPITHDGLDHVARIANFYKNLGQGNLIPRWAPDLNWGYGHPILMFLYPLPSYIASVFHVLGFSFINSFKLVLGLSFIFSGVFFYLWAKEFLDDNSALVGSILYLFAPYRFIDLYVRGALGEHVAFVFMPLTLLGIIKIFKSKNNFDLIFKSSIASIPFALLILSHNAISLIFIPFIIFYIFYLAFEFKSRVKLIFSFSSLGLGFLLSFFFWFPAFMEGKYTLRDIVSAGEYATRFVDPKTLIWGPWSFGGSGFFSVQIGIAHILVCLAAILFIKKINFKLDTEKYLLLGTFSILIVSIFLMMRESNFVWLRVTTLQKLQFPWRFLSIVVFLTSTIGAIFISKIRFTNKKYLTIFLILLAIIPTITYWHARDYKKIPDSFFQTTYAGTTDTGESAPIWSVRFMERKPKSNIEVIDGSVKIKKILRKATIHSYQINVESEKARIVENTLYFPGWEVLANGKSVPIEFQDQKHRGLMTFYLNKGVNNVQVIFKETKLRIVSDIISLASIFIPLGLMILSKKYARKFN